MLWEKYVYKFILISICGGFFATVFCVAFLFYKDTVKPIEYICGIVIFLFEATLVYLLWKWPEKLRLIGMSIYWALTFVLSAKLAHSLLFIKEFDQFVYLSPWMYMNYLMPYFIYNSRTATILSSSFYSIWLTMSGIYLIFLHEGDEKVEVLGILIQTYFSQCLVIVFVALYSRVQMLARTDDLLGIDNRRSMQTELNKQIDHAEKSGANLSVILIDIDFFKQINDTHGHQAGDAVLIEACAVLQKMLYRPNSLGRWGGEEFLIIMTDCTLEESRQYAEMIRRALEIHEFQTGRVTASFGVAQYRLGDQSQTLLKRADHALYKSKKLGRNRVEVG